MNSARPSTLLRALRVAVLPLALGAAGCDSDTPTPPADTLAADTSAPADTAPPVDTATPPDVTLVDPLPVAAEFDTAYTALGDAVVTTLVETLSPRYGYAEYVTDAGAMRVPPADFGRVEGQPGEPHQLRDQLALPSDLGAAALVPGALPATARSLFYGVILADVQIVDSDSPAQVAKNSIVTAAGIPLPAHRPHGELIAHTADAGVRTVGRFASPRAFDAALVLGDAIENGQHNELGWFLSVLNGGTVSVDSGQRDDIVPGPANDAFDPFVAAGLPAGTPWIAALGNHDFQINGNFPHGLIADLYALDPAVLALVTDTLGGLELTLPQESTASHHNAWFPHAVRAAFTVHTDAWFDPAQLPGVDVLGALGPADVPADPARAGMDACEFVAALRGAPGQPLGHGYTADHEADCTPWFTWDPVAGLPLRILSLALGPIGVSGDQGVLALPSRDGVVIAEQVGDPRFDQIAFLDAELARAKVDNVALIVVSHQPSWSVVTSSRLALLRVLSSLDPSVEALLNHWVPDPVAPLTTEDLRQRLAANGHVIAHLAGHTHDNDVRAICADGSDRPAADATRCPAGDAGATGYWEATTAGLVDFPHHARFVEVVHVAGRLGALYLTIAEPRIPAGSFSARGRFIARAEDAVHGARGGTGTARDRNLLLPFALPESLATAWAAAPAGPRVESETTLVEARDALPPLPEWPAP